MKKNLICFSLAAALVTGCGSNDGSPSDMTSGTGTTAGSTTASSTAAPHSTAPGSADTSSHTKVSETQPPAAPEEEPLHILTQSANAMREQESYEYTLKSISNFGDNQFTAVTEAVLFPGKGDGMTVTEEAGFTNTTYLKDNVQYREDPGSGYWMYIPMEPQDPGPVEIDERVNSYMEALETEDGYVVSSTRPLDLLEYYSITGTEEQERETIELLKEQGVEIETMVELWLDSEFRIIRRIEDQVTTSAGMSTGTLDEYEYRNYGSAPEVVVPQEVLEEAVEYVPDFDGPEEP